MKNRGNLIRNFLACGLGALGLLAFWLLGGTASLAQSPRDVVTPSLVGTVNTGRWEPPSPEPAGITYLPPGTVAAQARLLIADAALPDMDDMYEGANLFLTDMQGNLLQTFDTSSFARNVTGVTLNVHSGNLFMVDDDWRRIVEIAEPWSNPQIVTYLNSSRFGSDDPQDIAYDTRDGYFFVVDGRDQALYRIDPGSNGNLDYEDLVVSFDLEELGVQRPRGTSYDPVTDHVLVLDRDNGLIVELTKGGDLVREIDISESEPQNAGALALLPPVADGSMRALLVLDRGTWDDDDDDDDDDDEEGDRWTEFSDWTLGIGPTTVGAQPATTPLDHEERGGFLFTFDLPDSAETPTATPPGVTTTPGATGTPQATGTPGPTGTPVSDPHGETVFLPALLVQQTHDGSGEPNNACSQAFPLLVNRPYEFMPDDQDDWYHFTLADAAHVTVRLTNFTPLSGQIAVYRAAAGGGCEGAAFIQNNGADGVNKTLLLGDQPPARYYVYVSNDGTPTNNAAYHLQVESVE